MDLVAAGRRSWNDGNENALTTADASAQLAAPSGRCRTAAWNFIDDAGTAGMEASKVEKSRFRQWLARPPIPQDARSTRIAAGPSGMRFPKRCGVRSTLGIAKWTRPRRRSGGDAGSCHCSPPCACADAPCGTRSSRCRSWLKDDPSRPARNESAYSGTPAACEVPRRRGRRSRLW